MVMMVEWMSLKVFLRFILQYFKFTLLNQFSLKGMSEYIWNYVLIGILVFSILFIQFFIFINYLCHLAFVNLIHTLDDCDNLKKLKTDFI